MGIILSRYRKKKNAEELLEDVEQEIEDIENNKQNAVQREKYIVWRLIIYSFLLYITSAILFYHYFFPASLRDHIFYMIPLLAFPIIIICVKKCITWIYTRKIKKSKERLSFLRTRKKQILDDVMNKETYKVAKQILDKYAPEQVKKPTLPPAPTLKISPPGTPSNKSMAGVSSVALVSSGQSVLPLNTPLGTNTPMGSPQMMNPRSYSPPRRLIRPVIPAERTYVDRLIDALVGDGPSNRYALICKNCAHHNGMALKEEFEYLAFRCVYCGFPNPSLKTRSRPKLPIYTPTLPAIEGEPTEEKLSDLNKSEIESSTDNQHSGVEITEVTDTPEKHEGINHRKTIKTEEENNTTIITEEITNSEDERIEEDSKKTQ